MDASSANATDAGSMHDDVGATNATNIFAGNASNTTLIWTTLQNASAAGAALYLPPAMPPQILRGPAWPPAAAPITPFAAKLLLVGEAELALLVCGVVVVFGMIFIPPCVLVYKRWRRQRHRQRLIDEQFSGWRRGGAFVDAL